MQKPIITITLAYTAGILLGNAFLYFPYTVGILLACVIIISGVVAFYRQGFHKYFLVAIPCVGGMAAYLYSAAWIPSDHYTRFFHEDRSVHHLTGRIASVLDRKPDRTGFVLDVHEMDGRNVGGKVRVSVREATSSVGYGDIVLISGKLFRPNRFQNPGGFDYPAYLARSGIYHMLSVKNEGQVRVLVPGRGIMRTVQDWRERIRQAFLKSTSGAGSAILQAMVLGEEGELTEEMREVFLAAGVTHIISISGSHLGMIAVICFGFLNMLMRLLPERAYHRLTIYADPRKLAAWITLPLVIFYTLLAGGRTATVRALVMVVSALAALILDREKGLFHALAAAALIILVADPQALFDISFQLSFLSVISIGSVALLWKDLRIESTGRLNKLLKSAALLALLSIAASLATGPLAAHYFNQFSLAGLVSNLVVVPFAGMAVVPIGLASGITSLFSGELPLAWLNQWIADSFISSVEIFSRLPFAEFHPRSPGILQLAAYAILVASLFVILSARLLSKSRPLEYSSRIRLYPVIAAMSSFVFLAALFLFSFLPLNAAEVCVPDVGQGDSILVKLPGNRNILIDGGGTYDGRFDIGRRVLAPFLWNKGAGRLDLVILSHPHPDHMNGLKYILKKFEVGEVWSHGMDSHLPGYHEFVQIIRDRNIRHRTVTAGGPPYMIGEARVSVLHPESTFQSRERRDYAAENDRSLAVRIEFQGKVLLFTGDIGTGAEKALLDAGRSVKCDIVKAPHHGSKSSSSEEFLAAARPSLIVIPVGKGNRYRHPSSEVVARYERTGAEILRTDRDGALSIRFGRNTLSSGRWNDLELKSFNDIRQPALVHEKGNWKRLWIRKWEL